MKYTFFFLILISVISCKPGYKPHNLKLAEFYNDKPDLYSDEDWMRHDRLNDLQDSCQLYEKLYRASAPSERWAIFKKVDSFVLLQDEAYRMVYIK